MNIFTKSWPKQKNIWWKTLNPFHLFKFSTQFHLERKLHAVLVNVDDKLEIVCEKFNFFVSDFQFFNVNSIVCANGNVKNLFGAIKNRASCKAREIDSNDCAR